jgi:hypothetical protein
MINPMKIRWVHFVAAVAAVAFPGMVTFSQAQVFSQNIVGYYNMPLYAGNNLIANQLSSGSNDLNTFLGQNTPEGATFTEWNATAAQYLPLSTYDSASGWSIDYTLTFGQGGLLTTPSAFTNTFVGSVWSGFDINNPYNLPLVSGTGKMLLSCYIPIGNATFNNVVGRDPADGEYVTTLDPLTQQATTTTYNDGTWSNGDPLLQVGQSAFFGLGADGAASNPAFAPVPEPSTLALSGLGVLALGVLRRERKEA